MKKMHELYELFGAKVYVYVEKDGVPYSYQSHGDFPSCPAGPVLAANRMTPDDFITVAERRRRDQPLSPSPISSQNFQKEPVNINGNQRPQTRTYFNIPKN